MDPHVHPHMSTKQFHLGVVGAYYLVAATSAVLLLIFQLGQCADIIAPRWYLSSYHFDMFIWKDSYMC